MSKTHQFKVRHQLSEDKAGVVQLAYDPSGRKVCMRKFAQYGRAGEQLHVQEEVAYQVAIDRLTGVHHPSLREVVSGGFDPLDGMPYVATKPMETTPLAEIIHQSPLSVEMGSALLSQLLELCELLSHLLAEEGIWVETHPDAVDMVRDGAATHFLFWPSPLKALNGNSQAHDFGGIIELTEKMMGWRGLEVDERAGGHLQPWLKWLKEAAAGGGTTIREAREMLAAAAGVEPPPPIGELVRESQRKRSLLERWPSVFAAMKMPAPKMPLFALLSVMFVVQAFVGWLLVGKVNENLNERVLQINQQMYSHPYTIDRDPNRKPERGSLPINFDE